jgi:long-chain acyl-CoA synthetase
MNIAELICSANAAAIAVRGTQGEHTYGELDADSARLAGGLHASGIVPGARVCIAMPSTVAHIVAYYAVLRAGCTVVSVNPKSTVAELERLFSLARPDAVIASTETIDACIRALNATGTRPLVISDGPASGEITTAQAADRGRPVARPVARLDSDPAAILLTSGSTGTPRGVVLSHGNVLFAARAQAGRMLPEDCAAIALIAPLHHCFGQNAVMNAAFSAGGAVVLFDPRRSRRMVDDLALYQVSALPAVPEFFRVLLELGADADRLPGLRYAMSAASPLPERVAQTWDERFGFRLHEGYGLTESSPCALYNDQSRTPGSLGRPFDGVRARVVGENGTPVPDGGIGELQLQGPNIMQGYFEDPEATAAAFDDGWLRTGDQMRRDADGDYWMVGRAKNVIIVSGSNVFPSEVETLLLDHPCVAAAVAVGIPHRVLGEAVIAYVQLQDASDAGTVISDLRERCRDGLAPHKRPAAIRELAIIPSLTSGKPDLERIRALAVGGA